MDAIHTALEDLRIKRIQYLSAKSKVAFLCVHEHRLESKLDCLAELADWNPLTLSSRSDPFGDLVKHQQSFRSENSYTSQFRRPQRQNSLNSGNSHCYASIAQNQSYLPAPANQLNLPPTVSSKNSYSMIGARPVYESGEAHRRVNEDPHPLFPIGGGGSGEYQPKAVYNHAVDLIQSTRKNFREHYDPPSKPAKTEDISKVVDLTKGPAAEDLHAKAKELKEKLNEDTISLPKKTIKHKLFKDQSKKEKISSVENSNVVKEKDTLTGASPTKKQRRPIVQSNELPLSKQKIKTAYNNSDCHSTSSGSSSDSAVDLSMPKILENITLNSKEKGSSSSAQKSGSKSTSMLKKDLHLSSELSSSFDED